MVGISSRRNFGIMAHVDAGKTTLTERLLFCSGKLHSLGEVHEGTSTMDWMQQEQERGITITSATTTFIWRSSNFGLASLNIIDTPGHIDFSVEVERSLRVLDGVVIVLDSTSGVEPQTETVWNQANRYGLVRLVFCNKMDKPGSDYDLCLESLKCKLGANVLSMQIPIVRDHEFIGVVDVVNMIALFWECTEDMHNFKVLEVPDELKLKATQLHEIIVNSVIEYDPSAMARYLVNGKINTNELISLIRLATLAGEICPVFCGSAFKNKAIQPLLDGVVNYLPSPDDVPPAVSYDGADVRFSNCLEPLAALVFKIMSDDYVNNLSYVRIYSGVLIRGCTVSNPRTKILEKVTRIFKMHANVKSEISFVIAGDIAAITGFKNVITGDTLCELDKSIDLFKMKVPVPVIQMAIEPQLAGDQGKLTSILTKFASEDPSLLINKNADSGQIILAGMGELHLEVIIDRIGREYSINLKTNAPQVAYRETISRPRVEEYTHKKQSGGSGQFARVKLMFEQNGTNEFKFESKIIGGAIPKEFIPGVKRGLEEAFLCGPASGFPVIRIKATLLDGEYHDVDSSLLAFEIAAKFCYKQAVINVGALVLEPIMRVEVTMPSDCVGNVVCDLIAKRGRILSQVTSNKNAVVICLAPLAMLFKYIDSLRSLSKGRGSYSMGFECYSDMKNGETEVRAT